MKRDSKGITLIALIITIVVILIIAGISIPLVLNNDGILGKSGKTKNLVESTVNSETNKLVGVLDDLNEDLNNDIPENYNVYNITIESNLESCNTSIGDFSAVYSIIGENENYGGTVYDNIICTTMEEAGIKNESVNVIAPEGTKLTISAVYCGASYNLNGNNTVTMNLTGDASNNSLYANFDYIYNGKLVGSAVEY